jgi:hypothetical protein
MSGKGVSNKVYSIHVTPQPQALITLNMMNGFHNLCGSVPQVVGSKSLAVCCHSIAVATFALDNQLLMSRHRN